MLAALLALALCLGALSGVAEGYTLQSVTILSRHNLRAPLSSNGSVPVELTPHTWYDWTCNASELTFKGGVNETRMGQYFRKYFESEGLIPENYVPEAGEVRFYARSKQRCMATARYFATGMMPLATVEVEHPGEDDFDIFKPVLHFYSDAYAADAIAQAAELGGSEGFAGIDAGIRDGVKLIMDVTDMTESEAYRSGKYGDLMTDASSLVLEADKEPAITGPIQTATQMADALILQYYENTDDLEAAFGHEIGYDDWENIASVLNKFGVLRHGVPMLALNIANPVVRELRSELTVPGRKLTFLCAHDCTVLGVLTSLGVKDYALPGTIETKTPIGVKLAFERFTDEAGENWYTASLYYQSTEQLRGEAELTLKNPPMKYALDFEGVEKNADGYIAEADLLALFDGAIANYDGLQAQYVMDEAA